MEIRGRDVEAGGKASEKSPGKIVCVHNLYQGVNKIFFDNLSSRGAPV